MRIRWSWVMLMTSLVFPLSAVAQQAPQPTCEQRLSVVSQLADDLSMSRRNAEIEVAMLKAQKTAQAQAEATAKTATPPKEPDARP